MFSVFGVTPLPRVLMSPTPDQNLIFRSASSRVESREQVLLLISRVVGKAKPGRCKWSIHVDGAEPWLHRMYRNIRVTMQILLFRFPFIPHESQPARCTASIESIMILFLKIISNILNLTSYCFQSPHVYFLYSGAVDALVDCRCNSLPGWFKV